MDLEFEISLKVDMVIKGDEKQKVEKVIEFMAEKRIYQFSE